MNGQVKMQAGFGSVQNVTVPIGTGKEKRCLKCGEVKAVGEFNRRSEMKDGLRNECRGCISFH
jgi:hypothetical protein